MSTWHWVRHAPTHATSMVGWRDVPADLSDSAQIERVRAFLPEQAMVVSSDLSRARATADALCRAGHARLQDDPHLREIHFGRWDGRTFDEISMRDPLLSRQFWENPGNVMAPGGESWHMTSDRVQGAVSKLSRRYPDRHIIAVAHFGVILTQVQRALATSAYKVLAHRIDNLSVTSIDYRGTHPKALSINHLP